MQMIDSAALSIRSGRWPVAKVTVLVCFALACGMLIGSLLSPAHANIDLTPATLAKTH